MQHQPLIRRLARSLLVILGTISIIVGTTAVMVLVIKGPQTVARANAPQPVVATAIQPTHVPSPRPTPVTLIVSSPTVQPTATHQAAVREGEAMHNRTIDEAVNSMLYTSHPPLISQQEAMQIVADRGVPWARGGQWQGKPVTIDTTYGLATLGQPGDTTGLHKGDNMPLIGECAGWIGLCGLQVQPCHNGACINTGKVLGRLVNRPIWLLDYGNISAVGSKGPPNNHAVYIVDATEKFVLLIISYR